MIPLPLSKSTLSLLCLWLILVPIPVRAQEELKADALVHPKIAERRISVGGPSADVSGFDNQSIQFAIDALGESGGTVLLNPGQYEITAPVRLRSHVHLVGSGEQSVLKKGPGVQTRYIVDADFGELKLTVENPDGFSIGMKVQVSDRQNSSCWNVSTAYITDIADNILYVDRGMIRDYRSDQDGLVSNASSVVEIIDATDASVSHLVIDGKRSDNYFADGCNSAGILILRSTHISVDSVQVRDFNGEGISWQITEHVAVRHCEISGSGNTGLHPGTGSPFSIIENNNVHHNDRDGLYICWRVYQSRVKGNRFHHNGRYGLCTGHKDTDVIFEDNHFYSNGSDGVHLRAERESNAPHRNSFIRNIFENNGTREGAYGFSVNSPAKDLLLEENEFRNSTRTQKAAIYIYKDGAEPRLRNNRFEEHELGRLVFEKTEARKEDLKNEPNDDPDEEAIGQKKKKEAMNKEATAGLHTPSMQITYKSIGTFQTALSPRTGAPRQGALDPASEGQIILVEEYREALQGLERADYIIVLYHLNLSRAWSSLVRPPGSTGEFGLFATRSPNRPNPIGLAVLKLEKIEGSTLFVKGVDAYNGTPVLDIKPWIPQFDCPGRHTTSDFEKDLGLDP